MIVNFNLTNINILETYNVYYKVSGLGSNVSINDNDLTQYGGDFTSNSLLITVDIPNPFDKEIWIFAKEKNGVKFLTKNIYISGDEFFQGCITCCSFEGGTFTFNEWEIDCTFGVGTEGEIVCSFDHGDFTFNGWDVDCTFGVGTTGEIVCQFTNGTFIFDEFTVDCTFDVGTTGEIACEFNSGSFNFESYAVDCTFNVTPEDANIPPTAKIYRGVNTTDQSDLISGDVHIELNCVDITTFNGTTISSAIWQFQQLDIPTPWIDSTIVTLNSIQDYPTNTNDFKFRVKVVDSNGLIGYSNVIAKYYIEERNLYDANLNESDYMELDICDRLPDQVFCSDNPPVVGSYIFDVNNQPITGHYYCRIRWGGGVNQDMIFTMDPGTNQLNDIIGCP